MLLHFNTHLGPMLIRRDALANQQGWLAAGCNVGANLVLGIGAAVAGLALGRAY